jgi:aspartate/methionine/tyrosine aminotransferase
MSTYQADSQNFFRLKPIRAARVSEISETTAAAPIPKEARVNFHIGNPVQDKRLSSAFLRMALGIDIRQEELSDDDPDAILEYLDWDLEDKPRLEFLIRAIRNSSPYAPRGGYSRKNPHPLIDAFSAWLEGQQEPLRYDTGQQSGKREIILATGGIHETLRVILFALSAYLEYTPARILCYRVELLPIVRESIANLVFEDLPEDEQTAKAQIEAALIEQPETPTFLLIGDPLEEVTRRRLRQLSIEKPLFFIEANNAPNHRSLAREAKLVQRVIRLLTPGIFSPRLQNLATVFIAGNADILSVIENVHFNLKGTPSASEVEFLNFLLEQGEAEARSNPPADIPKEKPTFEGLALGVTAENALTQLGERIENYLEDLVDTRTQKLTRSLANFEAKTAVLGQKAQDAWKKDIFDELAGLEAKELFAQWLQNINQDEWIQTLQRSFLSAIVKHQPQYRPEACLVASGSSRTALGILGFHCGISEVIIPDLSWSYEQCFRKTHTVPLSESLALDVDAIIEKIEALCQEDPSWPNRGAVAINNPHNATGQIFDESAIRRLITYCLQHNIYIIDDLAYQNVAPVDGLPEIKTLRQIAAELVHFGTIYEAQADRLITVHSMSKTDCFAGARLAILEIRDRQIFERFEEVNAYIQPNIAAIFLGYLFYRNTDQATRTYWHLRNRIFQERTQALLQAVEHLPADRNPFHIKIIPPTGSMYPLLHIEDLPAGLSLDWLASSLARQGIGMLPLATFARTEKGFETGRTTFRLTLGGVDGAEALSAKTRRLLIDLNRLITEENARYNRKVLSFHSQTSTDYQAAEHAQAWGTICQQITAYCQHHRASQRLIARFPIDTQRLQNEFFQRYLPERLDAFQTRLQDRAHISHALMRKARSDNGKWLANRLEGEFMKDNLARRQERFKLRAYDRTVHPTQAYALQAELILDAIINQLIAGQTVAPVLIGKAAEELVREYLGLNVAITSLHEADEILADLSSLTAAEEYSALYAGTTLKPFLSFWSDWDGSNRPSGQGHRLVAAVVMENARRMAEILNLLRAVDPAFPVSPELVAELEALPQQNQRFTKLLNEITLLTHQLEQRYRGILPFSVESTTLGRIATRLHLRRDPARVLWQHNDRYERKMLDLRGQRKTMLEFYFGLNKKIRKQLHALIPHIQQNRTSDPLLREVLAYRDIFGHYAPHQPRPDPGARSLRHRHDRA